MYSVILGGKMSHYETPDLHEEFLKEVHELSMTEEMRRIGILERALRYIYEHNREPNNLLFDSAIDAVAEAALFEVTHGPDGKDRS
jgi:hypothetical protein